MKFTNTVTIDRPLAEVFAFLAQLENLPRWNYAISAARKTTPGPVGIGSKYALVRTLPMRCAETLEITEYEPVRTLSINGGLGPLRGRATYVLDPVGSATRVTNSMDLAGPGLLSVVAPLATAQIRAAVAANLDVLKQIVEEQ